MRRLACLSVAVLSGLALSGLFAPSASAQDPAAQSASPYPTGPGSLDGIWFGEKFKFERRGAPGGLPRERPTENGLPPQLKPWAANVVADRTEAFLNHNPYAKLVSLCIPGGVPAMMFVAPQRPWQVLESPGQVTILLEDMNIFRIIYLNEEHPENPPPTLMGHSVGWWEGDTLVVDTIAISDKSNLDDLIPHTNELHLVERFRRSGPETLDYRATIEDPKTLIEPYTVVFPMKHVPGQYVVESVCENQKNPMNELGRTTTELPTER